MIEGKRRFEFDQTKSDANRDKHGIDFEAAQAVWRDAGKWEGTLAFPDEPRSLVVGMIDGRLWSVVITYRKEAIRIISTRRSRPNEVSNYERTTSNRS